MRTILLIFFLCLMLIGCNRDDDADSNYTVSGYCTSNGLPVENVKVDLDGLVQYQTFSNSEGYFEINNVSGGLHDLKATKSKDNGTYIVRSYQIDVFRDLELNNLLLPNPVELLSAEVDTTVNYLTLIWNKSLADDFREYKLYSNATSALDETTGTLEHVTTSKDDTVFSLQMPHATTRFYRVFVLNEYGQLGGSNLKSATSGNINYFSAGNFENESLFFSDWTIEPEVYIIDSVSYNNSKSLYLFCEWDTTNNGADFTRYVIKSPPVFLNKYEEYRLSFWYKGRGLGYLMNLSFCYYYEQNSEYYLFTDFYNSVWEPEIHYGGYGYFDVDWTYYTAVFMPNFDGAIQFTFFGSVEHFYMDDLTLKKK